MSRQKSRDKIHIFKTKYSPCWYMWFISDETGKKVHKSTGYRRKPPDEYSREQVQRIIDNETGTKRTAEHGIEWMLNETLATLEIEHVSESTTALYKFAFKRLIELYGRDYSIHKIKRVVINDLKKFLLDKGNQASTINCYIGKLGSAFERFYLEERIDRNPFQKFKPMDSHSQKKQIFNTVEIKRLLEILNDHPNEKLKHLLRVALYTGLRRTEILFIERVDVNLSEMFFRAINCKSKDKHKVYKEIPKPIIADFEYFMNLNPLSPYPFKVYVPCTFSYMTKKLLREHNFHEDLHLHSLRHTAITRAIESGMPIRDIQKIVDHEHLRTTEGYTHDIVRKALELGLE